MIFIMACLLILLVIVLATGLLEAWARHRRWPGYISDDELRWRLRK